MSKRTKKKLFRLLFTLFILGIFFLWEESIVPEKIEAGKPAKFYSTQDHLQAVYLKAIQNAQESIFLTIYTLSDEKILRALQKRANEGVIVQIFYDPSTKHHLKELKVKKTAVKVTGLMHQKILVVDHQLILLGSTNLTPLSLKFYDNLVAGLSSFELAETIEKKKTHHYFTIGGQMVEFWEFPRDGHEGISRLIQLIDRAKTSLKIGMFTWTHPELTKAVLRAHRRGVEVEIALDHRQTSGVNKTSFKKLKRTGIDVRLGPKDTLLHHKFVWIDQTILVNGSANWTRSAFTRNADCFLIFHNLTEEQKQKLEKMWKRTYIQHGFGIADLIQDLAA